MLAVRPCIHTTTGAGRDQSGCARSVGIVPPMRADRVREARAAGNRVKRSDMGGGMV